MVHLELTVHNASMHRYVLVLMLDYAAFRVRLCDPSEVQVLRWNFDVEFIFLSRALLVSL